MALNDFVSAFCMLLGTLLIPFIVLYQMLRIKRRTIRITAPAPFRGNRR